MVKLDKQFECGQCGASLEFNPLACSGDMYPMVPRIRRSVAAPSSGSMRRAIPQSIT